MKSLWERLRQNDAEAMVLLYEQSYADLLIYGVQLCNNTETAKDAINDVFLNLWDSRSRLKPVENVKAYLFACARRQIFQTAAINKKGSLHGWESQLSGQTYPSPEVILIAMERSEEVRCKVQRALEKLTERQKELIRMKYFKGMDYRQIEMETGVSMKTAYNTVYNAMKILSDELKDIFLILILFLCFFSAGK
jgi:RNA polymerase sigma-70 factor (ECF subfamily)